MIKKYRFTTFLLLFILSGIYIFIFSESGVLERIELEKEKRVLIKRIETLKIENITLSKIHKRYSMDKFSEKDLSRAGYVKSGSKIIVFNRDKLSKIIAIEKADNSDDNKIRVFHLRVIFIVISILLILFYFFKILKTRDEYN